MITKDEVRAVTIHKLRLPRQGVLWDVGAGSGSVSIEAARLCPELAVFAVEKNEEQIAHINENKKSCEAGNIETITGGAPDICKGLPKPDRVFIGGSAGRLEAIVKTASGKMNAGIIVVNAATIETLHEALKSLVQDSFSVDVTEVSVSRSKIIQGKRHMSALNPVFIVRGEKV